MINIMYVPLYRDSVCQSCGEQLPCNDLSVDEYSQLLRHFEDNVKVEAGTESEREQSIVQALGRIAKERVGNPYGAVLDGLNIVHDQWFSRYDRSDPVSCRLCTLIIIIILAIVIVICFWAPC